MNWCGSFEGRLASSDAVVQTGVSLAINAGGIQAVPAFTGDAIARLLLTLVHIVFNDKQARSMRRVRAGSWFARQE